MLLLIIGYRYTVYSRPSMTAHCTITIRNRRDQELWHGLIRARVAELVEFPIEK